MAKLIKYSPNLATCHLATPLVCLPVTFKGTFAIDANAAVLLQIQQQPHGI